MAIDATGDVWLTGDTNSPDYPVTNSGDITVSKIVYDRTRSHGLEGLASSIPVGIPSRLGTIPSLNNLAIDSQGNIVVADLFGLRRFHRRTSPAPLPGRPRRIAPLRCGSNIFFVESAVYVDALSAVGMGALPLDTRVYPASPKSISLHTRFGGEHLSRGNGRAAQCSTDAGRRLR